MSRRFRNLRYSIFYGLMMSKGRPLITLGNAATGCAWTFCPKGLNAKSVIYSGGVGNDITFEHALVQRFGCNVVLCDPSPTGLATMARPENRIPQFKFLPTGISGAPGVLKLSEPQNAEEGSWYLGPEQDAKIEVPCTDLATIMREQGHTQIDLLKLDIEGSEYSVLDDIVARQIPVRQICVEFHHAMFPGLKRSQTIRAILKLRRLGFRLICQEGANHTFLRDDSRNTSS